MNCRQCQERLVEYVEQSLDDTVHRDVQAHLEGCEECRLELTTVRQLHERLVHSISATPAVSFR